MNNQSKQKLIDFLTLQNIDIDFQYYLGNADFSTFDEICDILDGDGAFNQEVIYYSKAIKYLQENDPSLQASLEIASDLGYDPKNLNSEILASLHKSEQVRTEFYELQSEIEDLIEELVSEEEQEEEE
jgi:hypothetical protein